LPKHKTAITKRLQCVLAPESLCLGHFGICNPGQQSREFGRAIMYQNRLPLGFYAMDSLQVGRAYDILDLAYQECAKNVDKWVDTKFGAFRLVRPLV
jgi:hypothetical protein